MGGIAGMGSVKKVSTPSEELNIPVPGGMAFEAPTGQYVENAPPPQERPSLDQIFAQSEPSQRPSLDQIFGSEEPAAEEEFTEDQPSFRQRFGNVLESAAIGIVSPVAGYKNFQGGELKARSRAAMQVSDKEIKQSLELDFGKENVRTKDEEIQYKGEDKKWRVWDGGTTVEDFTVDMIRPAIEEIPASVATMAASVPAIASMIASVGASTPLSVGGVATARAGGAMLGQATADFMQGLTGVPRDQDRSALLEYGLTAVLSPAAGLLADYATKSIAKKAASSQARKLMTPESLHKEEINGIKEGLAKVKELGGMENLPDTDTPVMLYHLNPSNETARELTEKASSLKGYAQMEEHLVQNFDDSSKTYLRTLGNINPDNMKSGTEFKSYVQEAIKKEGASIGAVRDGLIDAAGNGELPIPKLKSNVEAFARDLGFQVDGSTNIAGLKNYLVDEQGYSKQAAEVIVNKTNKMLEKVTNKEGRMTAKELVGAYEEMNGVYRNIVQGGGEVSPLFKRKIGEFRRFFADELADKVEVVADKTAKSSYMTNLKNYRELVSSADEFANLLDKDNLASHSLSKAIFSKGANGLDSAEAAKTLLRDRPDLLDDVKGSFLQDVMSKSVNKLGKTDWTKFNSKILDPELRPIIKSIFGDKAVEGFKAYETVAKAIENGNVGAANSADRALLMKNMGSAAFSKLAAANAMLQSLKGVSADNAFMEIVSKEGIDNFIKTAPKDSKPWLKQFLSGMQKATMRSLQAGQIPLRRAGKNWSKDGANSNDDEETP